MSTTLWQSSGEPGPGSDTVAYRVGRGNIELYTRKKGTWRAYKFFWKPHVKPKRDTLPIWYTDGTYVYKSWFIIWAFQQKNRFVSQRLPRSAKLAIINLKQRQLQKTKLLIDIPKFKWLDLSVDNQYARFRNQFLYGVVTLVRRKAPLPSIMKMKQTSDKSEKSS